MEYRHQFTHSDARLEREKMAGGREVSWLLLRVLHSELVRHTEKAVTKVSEHTVQAGPQQQFVQDK